MATLRRHVPAIACSLLLVLDAGRQSGYARAIRKPQGPEIRGLRREMAPRWSRLGAARGRARHARRRVARVRR